MIDAFEVHCPKCGAMMEDVDGYLTCIRGGIGVSTHMRDSLRGLAVLRPAIPPSSTVKYGSPWFCAADGSELVEIEGRSQCPACGRYLPGHVKHEYLEYNLPAEGHPQ